MFTNTPPPLHAQQAAARLNEGARTFIIYFTLSCALRVFPYASLSLYASLSTRLSLRVSIHVSLYASPFLYKRGTGETRAAEPQAEPRVEA
jgi:hypothetical protein